MHLVLEPRAMPHDLVAPRHQPALAFGLRIRCPDLRQVARRLQAGECTGVDLVSLDVRLSDRLHLQWIGDNHPRHEWRQHPRHRHAISGRLDHHFIGRPQTLAHPFKGSPGHVDPTGMSNDAVFPDYHLAEGSVNINTNHASHLRVLPSVGYIAGAAGDTTTTDSRPPRHPASRRGGQLLTRALGSSYVSACPHFVLPVPLSRWSHHTPRCRTPQRNVGTEKSHTGY